VNTTLAPTSIARLVKACWFSLFGVALVLTAWVSDDAYMTFRTIDNFVHGYGLRWNAAERVQAYTHPLWMSLVAVFYWWTGEPYFTSIALSIALTLLAVWLVMRLAPSIWSAGAGLTILWCSRAFIDYSTSGLENPLTNVLLLLFVGCYLSPRRRFFVPALLAALIMLNRLDVGLLVLPALVVLLPRRVSWREWAAVAAGFLPLLIWELFSVFYYGVPFPNTAYAKLKTGVPESDLLQQGFIYLVDSVRHDPVTLLATAAVTAWAMVDNPRGTRPIAVGIVCYVAYVTYVGGDFMSGRMFVAPLLAAVAILVVAGRPIVRELQWALVPLALLLGFNASRAFVQPGDPREALSGSGIADERMWYFPSTGLVNYTRGRAWPSHPWAEQGRRVRQEDSRFVVNCCNGMLGYYSGPQAYILDTLALGDPLLARLPADKDWRIGHFIRGIPKGYVETIQTGFNQLADRPLASYYDRLSLVTRGPLTGRRRLSAVLRFNLGQYEDQLRRASDAPGPCVFTLTTESLRMPQAGGTETVSATANMRQGCLWVAAASDPWLALNGATSGASPASITITVAANKTIERRTGTIAITSSGGTATLTVVQAGLPPCSYALTPAAQTTPSAGGTSVFVVTPSDPMCAWQAEPASPWLSIVAGINNTGPGAVQYAIKPNDTRAPRSGTITVVGAVSGRSDLTVTQP